MKSLFDTLVESEKIENISWFKMNSPFTLEDISGVEGIVKRSGREYKFRIGLDDYFPYSIPEIFLVDSNDDIGPLPHLSWVDIEGNQYYQVCHFNFETTILPDDPIETIKNSIDMAIKIIENGISGVNTDDYYQEINSYWGNLLRKGLFECYSDIEEMGDKVKRIYFKVIGRVNMGYLDVKPVYKEIGCFTERREDNPRVNPKSKPNILSQNETDNPTLYIPLQIKHNFIPPTKSNIKWTTADLYENMLQYVSRNNQCIILDEIENKGIFPQHILFKIPWGDNKFSLIGLAITGIKNKHPLLAGGDCEGIWSILVTRIDDGYLLNRGGANPLLTNKKILLVGTGALGGFVAHALARSGIRNLELVDKDDLSIKNVYRHVLGLGKAISPNISIKKVSLLKEELLNKYPKMNVSVFERDARKHTDIFKKNKYDVIIFSTGNVILERYFNRRLYNNGSVKVFGWIEGGGVGGHSILINPKTSSGCLECIFDNTKCRATFVKSGENFPLRDEACNETYTPFGASDVEQIAINISGQVVQYLLDTNTQTNLISWKNPFFTNNYDIKLVNKAITHPVMKIMQQPHIVQAGCSVCG